MGLVGVVWQLLLPACASRAHVILLCHRDTLRQYTAQGKWKPLKEPKALP